MILTGKCRQAFIDWFHRAEEGEYESITRIMRDGQPFDAFEKLSDSMQYGVLEDFFDSVGIEMSIEPCTLPRCYIANVSFDVVSDHKTRPEARTAAVNKANDLFNER